MSVSHQASVPRADTPPIVFPFELQEPDLADACEVVGFLVEDTFDSWLFAVANLILDCPGPNAKWLAERISHLGYRAQFFGAASPEQYDAIEAVQEQWLAERNGGVR